MDSLVVKIPQFEGPLELLCTLAQKEEIPIYELDIHSIVLKIKELLSSLTEGAEATFINSSQDFDERGKSRLKRSGLNEERRATALCDEEDQSGEAAADKISDEFMKVASESIGFAGHLLLLKSRHLLPQEELSPEEEQEGLNLSLMENLVEYCRFKEAARALAMREEQASGTFTRYKFPQGELKKPLGIDHLSLTDLSNIFEHILARAAKGRSTIENEEWQVTDKIAWIQKQVEKTVPFESLFPLTCSKLELIVIFLALLEMMKQGTCHVVKEKNTILVYGKERN